MPRRAPSREKKKKGKETGEWKRTLRTLIPPSETPFPSPWAEFPVTTTPASSLPTPRNPDFEERELKSAATTYPEASSSAFRGGTGSGPRPKAARVRHSAMYSDRPRRSQRNPGGGRAQQSTTSQVEEEKEGSSKASSNELGPRISDTSKFETLSLDDSPPALDSTHGSEERTEVEWPLDNPTFDSVDDAFEYFFKSEQIAQAARDKARTLSRQASLEKYEAEQALLRDQARPVLAEELSELAAQRRYEGFKGKLAENGMQWMSEEVWEAFQKYLEKEDTKDHDYEFDQLKKQCFHVENYCKIFHHFNFIVKMKEPGSSEWTSKLFFAEVKEILQRKIYFCCPIDSDENGDCYACQNQQMKDLQHPIIGAFDRGSPDTVFPFMCVDDSSSDDDDGPVYDEAWRRRMRAAGAMVG